MDFFNVLTSPALLETTESVLPEHRERLYPPTVALSMFMRQVLEAAGSCQKAVNGWAAQRAVKLVDGTGISMPDTPENQAVYPQPNTKASGVGFPQARLVMVICLATGAALDMAVGPHSGKGSGELGLVRSLLDGFSAGDVMLADALYCNYFLIATLMAAGVDVLFEQNGSRITDFRRGRSLSARDHIVHWPKPARPQWMTPEQYADLPDELTVREVKVAHQVLVTTLLDHRQVRKNDLSELYARRWNVELDLAQPQDHHGHGRAELPDAADEREAAVGPSAGLQRDPPAHGAGRLQCRRGPAWPELQAHGANVDRVDLARPVGHEGSRAIAHPDRPVPSKQPARAYRAANAKATTQTLPVVEDSARPSSTKDRAPWSRPGDKVSPIRIKTSNVSACTLLIGIQTSPEFKELKTRGSRAYRPDAGGGYICRMEQLPLFSQSLLIGFSIAAPVGPIGLLTIQRSLVLGSRAGLATGLGAAFADAVYGAIGAFGVAWLIHALTALRLPLALLGGGYLLWMAIGLLRSPLVDKAAPVSGSGAGLWRYFSGTFVLTLANPATIFSFVAIFGSMAGAGSVVSPWTMVLGVLVGSALWWFLLSGLVGLLRERFDARWRRRINLLSASILVAFAVWQLVLALRV